MGTRSKTAGAVWWLLLCVFGAYQVVCHCTPEVLAYRSVFDPEDAEYRESMTFLREVNAACVRGDVPGLMDHLTDWYAERLRRRIARTLSHAIGPSDLRAMQQLVPIDAAASRFLLGGARGSRVMLVFCDPSLSHQPGQTAAICLTGLPLVFDGRRFRLATPQLRQVSTADRLGEARTMLEGWLSSR